jgi:tetratricopeptide (TPR) repeat protein
LAAVFRDRGIARATVGDDAGALEDFARADDLISELPAAAGAKNRRWADMRARRGWILLLNAQKQALADFEAVLKENPKDFEALVGRGYARVKLGDWKLATLDAAAAVQLAPKSPGVLFNAAGIFAQASVAVVEESTPAEAAEKSTEFHEKAVALLRECFTACRNDKERAFYLRSARTDPALNPLKSRPALAALLEEFAAGERRP